MKDTGTITVYNHFDEEETLRCRLHVPLNMIEQLGFTLESLRFQDSLSFNYERIYPDRSLGTEAHQRYLSQKSRIIGKAFNELLEQELLKGNEVVLPGGKYSFQLFKSFFNGNSKRAKDTNGQKILLMMRMEKDKKTGLRFIRHNKSFISHIHGYPNTDMRRKIKKKLDEGIRYPNKVLPYLEDEL